MRLIGENAKQVVGENLKDMDLNTLTDPAHKELILERQRLYHDGLVGRVGIFEFRFPDGTTGFYEITTFPLWGSNGERLIIFLYIDVDEPKNITFEQDNLLRATYKDEIMIDIGAGVPSVEHEISSIE